MGIAILLPRERTPTRRAYERLLFARATPILEREAGSPRVDAVAAGRTLHTHAHTHARDQHTRDGHNDIYNTKHEHNKNALKVKKQWIPKINTKHAHVLTQLQHLRKARFADADCTYRILQCTPLTRKPGHTCPPQTSQTCGRASHRDKKKAQSVTLKQKKKGERSQTGRAEQKPPSAQAEETLLSPVLLSTIMSKRVQITTAWSEKCSKNVARFGIIGQKTVLEGD